MNRIYLKITGAVLIILVLVLGLWQGYKVVNRRQTAVPEKTIAKIGYLPITDHLVLGISQERDGRTFRRLKLRPLKFTSWKTISANLASGQLDGAILLAPLAFQLKLDAAPVKIVLLAHRDGSALTVKVKDNINSVADLKGTKIAIPHRLSTHHYLLHFYTSQADLLEGRDYEIVELPPPDMPLALARGEIDGYIVAEPYGAQAEVLGIGKVLVFSSQIWKHHPDCVLVMREEYLNSHPEAVKELLQSLIKSGQFIEENRPAAAEIGVRFLGHSSQVMLQALTQPADRVTFTDLIPQKEEFVRIRDYMTDTMKLFSQKIDLDQLIDTSFAQSL